MSEKEIEDNLRDRKNDLEHVNEKLKTDWVLEDSDEFSRLCNRRVALENEIKKLEKELSDYLF
ncbi:MAG: hypothetical protein WCG08_17125 [Paludibacter sp.]